MVQPKRFLPSAGPEEGERPKRQNSGDLRPRSRRLSSEEEEYTTDESSDEEEELVRPAPSRKSSKAPRRWQPSEDRKLAESVKLHGEANWKAIASQVGSRNHVQCLQRWKKVLRPGLVKGQWSAKEDAVLMKLATSGYKNWGVLSNHMPGRTSKQCRERWCHHLDPSINKGAYSQEEDKIIIETQARLGNKWSQIAARLPGRTENSIKIRCKALQRKGTSGGGGGGGGGQSATHAPRSAKKASMAATSRSRASSGASASSAASASSCVSAADSIGDQPLSERGDASPTHLCSSPPRTPPRCHPSAMEKFELLSRQPSPNVWAPAGSATPFSTPHLPFFQRRSVRGNTLRLHAASYPAGGGGGGAFLGASSPAPEPVPCPAFTPLAEQENSGWTRTAAPMEVSARSSAPLSPLVAPWSSCAAVATTTAAAVKEEFPQQRLPPVGTYPSYSCVERSSSSIDVAGGGCVAFGAAVPAAPGVSRSQSVCGVFAQAPLSQYFERGANMVMGQVSTVMGLGQACATQPPAGPGGPQFGGGMMSSSPAGAAAAAAAAGELAVPAEKEEETAVFGDFNALGVDDLKAVVGGDDEVDNVAPLRACCSFLDLPAEGMVVGDMPLSW